MAIVLPDDLPENPGELLAKIIELKRTIERAMEAASALDLELAQRMPTPEQILSARDRKKLERSIRCCGALADATNQVRWAGRRVARFEIREG